MIDTSLLKWDKEKRVLRGSLSEMRPGGSFPSEFYLRSSRTNRIIKFFYDHQAAQNAEWWDGECAEYLPAENCKVKKLVVMRY